MKKIVLSLLAALVVVFLVLSSVGIRQGRRLLASKPKIHSAQALPSFAWLPLIDKENRQVMLFDFHETDAYTAEIRFPLFSTVSGWSLREKGGTWAVGHRAVLDFVLDTISDRTLVLNTNPTGDLFEDGQSASVTVNGAELGRVRFSNAFPLSTLQIPSELQEIGSNRLAFDFDHTVRPADRRGSGDSRPLAAWFRNITIMDGSFGPVEATLRTIKMFSTIDGERKSSGAYISRKNRLVLSKPGTFVTAIAPDGRNRLEMEIRPRAQADSLTVTAHDLMGQEAPAKVAVEAGSTGAASAGIELPAHFQTAFLEISVTEIGTKPLRITAPWLTAMDFPLRRVLEPPEKVEDPLPNLVVIILDAARAENFGCYGSQRPTTPNIDALAADSVVFPEAVALAPYTLCSVPTMATGLSFLDHGVTARGQSLSRATTTLAELLSEAGYETAAFTATPNNSKKLGVEQGFEVFEEAWRGVDRGPALDPHRLVALAGTWLDTASTTIPFHLMVHMVPPHEPYEPGAEFDIFSDPEYDGLADGSRSFIDLFNHEGGTAVTQADLTQTRSLYDGNLLKADDAVGLLLTALKRRPDWDRTAVLITSDHGESLGEHGRIGHNAQVYEPMVRVPFILRLPQGISPPSAESTMTQVSLADLAPTMAALAGQGFPDPLAGQNLMDRSESAPQAIIMRTAHENPAYGLRTPRWKFVLQTNTSEMELFDLSVDPEERNDCSTAYPVVTAGLRQILLTGLADEPLFLADDEASLSGQDEAMLRTLGYLE